MSRFVSWLLGRDPSPALVIESRTVPPEPSPPELFQLPSFQGSGFTVLPQSRSVVDVVGHGHEYTLDLEKRTAVYRWTLGAVTTEWGPVQLDWRSPGELRLSMMEHMWL